MLLRKKLVFNVLHTLPRFHVDSNLRTLICKLRLFFTRLEKSMEATDVNRNSFQNERD